MKPIGDPYPQNMFQYFNEFICRQTEIKYCRTILFLELFVGYEEGRGSEKPSDSLGFLRMLSSLLLIIKEEGCKTN